MNIAAAAFQQSGKQAGKDEAHAQFEQMVADVLFAV